MFVQPSILLRFGDDRQDGDAITVDIVVYSDFSDAHAVLRVSKAPQALYSRAAHLRRRLPQVYFHGIAHGSAVERPETPKVGDGIICQYDVIGHGRGMAAQAHCREKALPRPGRGLAAGVRLLYTVCT